MICPLGRVKASVHPFTVVVLVLVMVMDAVRPLFQALTEYATRQAPDEAGGEPGVEAGGEPGVEAGGEPGVDRSRPKNWMAASAMPLVGRLCPAPWMLYASTWSPYLRRFQLLCGVSV